MLLWNAVDGFTEIDDPFLIKDNEILYNSSQSEYVFPGIDGFTSSIEEVWGGIVSSGSSSNGIIVNTVDTMDTVANTIVLPRSIMLYAVDAIPIKYNVSYQSRYNVLDGHINSLFYKKYPVNHSIVLLRCFMANSSNSKVEFIAHSTSTKTSCNLFIDFFTDSSTTTPDRILSNSTDYYFIQ